MYNKYYMFMSLATSLVVLLALFWLYLGNSQVIVYRTIGPTLYSKYFDDQIRLRS